MRKQLVKALTKIGWLSLMAMVMAVGSAQGQSLANKIRVNIPFDFTVADKKLPAGEYSINRAQQHSGDTVLVISNMDHVAKVFPLTFAAQTVEPKCEGTLIFHRYGDQYFLFQVWPAGATTGRVMVKSRSEREIEQKARHSAGVVARRTKAVETVPVVVGLH